MVLRGMKSYIHTLEHSQSAATLSSSIQRFWMFNQEVNVRAGTASLGDALDSQENLFRELQA